MRDDREATFARKLRDLLCEDIKVVTRVAGGDINDAFRVDMANNVTYFVKTHRSPPPEFFSSERDSLIALKESDAVAVPNIHLCHDAQDFSCLVLEWIDVGEPTARSSVALGEALANLHRTTRSTFGFYRSNYIGTLTQDNPSIANWATFYGRERILPMVKSARQKGLLPPQTNRLADQVLRRLPDLVGATEPPSLIHGDLWGGNHLIAQSGRPWLIDPATYFADREVDLAMMLLFGGFRRETFETYREAFPMRDGWQDRIELYQLYPMLVHLNLFGRSYLPSVHRILERYA